LTSYLQFSHWKPPCALNIHGYRRRTPGKSRVKPVQSAVKLNPYSYRGKASLFPNKRRQGFYSFFQGCRLLPDRTFGKSITEGNFYLATRITVLKLCLFYTQSWIRTIDTQRMTLVVLTLYR